MAEATPLTTDQFESAANEVEQFLHSKLVNVTAISTEDLQLYCMQGHVFIKGWEFAADFAGVQINLRILADQDFPFSVARIGIAPPHDFVFAHLESGSLLCLDPAQSVCWNRPSEAVAELLSQATEVIESGLSADGTDEETRREIIAYWDKSEGKKRAKGLLSPNDPARMIHMVRYNRQTILSDNRADAKSYISSGGGKLKPTQFGEKVPLLWLKRPPSNSQLPSTIASFVRLVLDEAVAGTDLLEEYLLSSTGRNTVILAFADENGVGFIGVEFPKVRFQNGPAKALAFIHDSDMTKEIERISIRREDADWVFGRDQNKDLESLRTANVAMIGAGSLGSYVALSLASAGIGRIELIDPQIMMAENTSRHVLGANYIGLAKADALAGRLRSQFKVSEFASFIGSWQNWVKSGQAELSGFDLVISTIGDWPSEAHLATYLRSQGAAIPALFAWLEPRAIASQAVFLPNKSPCLFCGFTNNGEPIRKVTDWDTSTHKRAPLCGGHFQPYGANALLAHSSHIAGQAVNAILGNLENPTNSFQSLGSPDSEGGNWSDWWKGLHGGTVPDACRIEMAWRRDKSCRICGDKT
jgi:molybdopterin/thiamine biosynthesis adenylyltransferase